MQTKHKIEILLTFIFLKSKESKNNMNNMIQSSIQLLLSTEYFLSSAETVVITL